MNAHPSITRPRHRWLRCLAASPRAVLALLLLAPSTARAQTRYEAEDATLERASKVFHANASPVGSTANNCVSQANDVSGTNNGTVTFNHVSVTTSGLYTMTVGYYEAWGTRNTFISVNGTPLAAPVSCPNGSSPDLLGTVTTAVPLKAGINNTIAIYNHQTWGPHWDYIEIAAEPASLLGFVTATADVNGSISPSGLVAVALGGSQNFIVKPNNAYRIDSVMDGATELTGTDGVYTVGPVDDDTHEVMATFQLSPTHELSGRVTAAAGGGATVSVKGSATSLPLYSATTDASGTYTMDVPEGTWYVCASQTGYMISVDTTVTLSENQSVDFALVAGRSIPQMESLLFAADSDSLGDEGTTGNWPLLYSTYPGIAELTAYNSPMVAKVNGLKYDNNLYLDNDGYRLNPATTTTPIPTSGASIITVVKPVRNATGNTANLIAHAFYPCLALTSWNGGSNAGKIRIYRNNLSYDSSNVIPDGQLTLISLVVAADGTFNVWTRAWNNDTESFDAATLFMNSMTASAFSAFTPLMGGTNDYRKRIGVGGRDGDGTYAYNGYIGDTFIYKSALTDVERETLEADINAKLTSITTYAITASAGAGGSISPEGVTVVGEAGSQTYTITPAWDHDVAQVTIDGTTHAGPVTTYTFDNVSATHTIEATFAAKPVVSASGTVTVGGVATDEATVNAYTDAACMNLVLTTATGPGSTYTLSLPQNTTMYLQATKSGFGPSAPLTVVLGSDDLTEQILDITSRRYEAEDGVLVEPTIGTSAYASGGKNVATRNDNVKCTVTFSVYAQSAGDYPMVMGYYQPNEQYRYTSLIVNGVSKPNIPGAYTLPPNYSRVAVTIPLDAGINTVVLSNVVWGVYMDYIDIPQAAYVVAASAGTNGSISPSGTTFVAPGESQTFTITPDSGFMVDQVLIDGVNDPAAAAAGSHTFSGVAKDHTIAASFIAQAEDPYGLWIAGYFPGDPANSAKGADPDHDGMTNLQEFAFGFIPNSGSSLNPITAQLNKSGTFSYTRRVASGLTYTVWTSTNLATWVQDTGASQVAGTPLAGVETVAVTLTGPPVSGGKLFVRVQAQ